MRGNAGFTLIELILVTVIIGILAGMVTLTFAGRTEEARVGRARADLVRYQDAVDLYAIDHNDKYPGSLSELKGGERDYVRKVAKDPWGNEYVYVQPGKHNKKGYDIFSSGPDKQSGTEDDINSWDE